MSRSIVRRLYVYVAAFLGLQLLAIGTRDLLSTIATRALLPTPISGSDQIALQLSFDAALMLVGLPLWFGHWWWAQRRLDQPDERPAALRRLYLYLVLVIATLSLLFNGRTMLDTLLAIDATPRGEAAIGAISGLLVNGAIALYHGRVTATDRSAVEPVGAAATLRRWYLLIVQAVSLSIAAYAAVDTAHRLIQQLIAPPIGATSGVGAGLASLIAGLGVWVPHHLWARRLIRHATPLRADEARSTLRQVYGALVITVASIAALGGLAALLYALLRTIFGIDPWRTLLIDHTQALATTLVAGGVWWYHRAQIADEAERSAIAARIDTARRVIGYLTAAVGLGALFFGVGGLLGTILRSVFAPNTLGNGWRDILAFQLALAIVAVPVYGVAARSTERLVATTPAEERTPARRIYVFAALFFGIVAAIVAAVAVLRLGLGAILGATIPDAGTELGGWLGYLAVGAAITGYYVTLIRRMGSARSDLGSDLRIVVLADPPLRDTLVTAIEREAPGVTIITPASNDQAAVNNALAHADLMLATTALLEDQTVARQLRAFSGARLLVPTAVPGYETVGVPTDAALAHAVARSIRLRLTATATPPPAVSGRPI